MPKYETEIYVELWEEVRLTDEERDALIEAAERGDVDEADRITDGAYDRLLEQTGH